MTNREPSPNEKKKSSRRKDPKSPNKGTDSPTLQSPIAKKAKVSNDPPKVEPEKKSSSRKDSKSPNKDTKSPTLQSPIAKKAKVSKDSPKIQPEKANPASSSKDSKSPNKATEESPTLQSPKAKKAKVSKDLLKVESEKANPAAPIKQEEPLDEEILRMNVDDLKSRTQLLDNEIRIMRSEVQRINHGLQSLKDKIKENTERIKVNKTLPYLVSNVIELLELEETVEEEGANVDLDAAKTQCAVIKTSTRATYFLPVVGLVDSKDLKPGDLVGVNKDSYLVLEKLPAEYDSRVKAMEVDERPTEQYSDIGGADKQITELIEAIVLPMTHKDRFINLGIHPPKGVLLYGPPGTGKTMMARAVAAQTKSTFLKLAGPQLVQMFIGDGAKLVRDAFALAKEKAPAIIFIDELDAIGTKRFDSEKAGDREVQRTMLELLNQLDGFQPNDDIKVIAATNRIDVLDPALLRSGRLDRKIELPLPTEVARGRIMQIHARKMNVHKDVNFEELARCTDDFNGAQCKAVCVEAGMIALRRDAIEVTHEDFMDAILEVQAKKKTALNYYA